MNRNSFLIIIFFMTTTLFSGNGFAYAQERDFLHETDNVLRVMDAQAPSDQISFVEEYINQSNAEPVFVSINPSTPMESRRSRQMANNDDTNTPLYQDLMGLVWIQYTEDLNYSSYILDEFVKKNISSREAMTTTMTLFELTAQTTDMVDQFEAPSKFETYHNATLQALINLEGYLWNMVKFYETNKKIYAVQAHDNFNQSMRFHEKGMILYREQLEPMLSNVK